MSTERYSMHVFVCWYSLFAKDEFILECHISEAIIQKPLPTIIMYIAYTSLNNAIIFKMIVWDGE